jgi:hypothetical protein
MASDMDDRPAPGSATSTDLTSLLAQIDRALADADLETARSLAEALLEPELE